MSLFQPAPLSRKSTFAIGGTALQFCQIRRDEELFALVDQIDPLAQKTFLGAGSNLLFPDADLDSPLLQVSNQDFSYDPESGLLHVGAGHPTPLMAKKALDLGLDMTPFFTIPGSIGGAIAGNAGWPPYHISDYLQSFVIFDWLDGIFREVSTEWLRPSYRHTRFHDQPLERSRYLIWHATFSPPTAERELLEERRDRFVGDRRSKQPVGKTAGSFFMNPEGQSAGQLLESVGMKNESYQGAFVSEIHANFFMNDGSATQESVLHLAKMAQKRVYEEYGIHLFPEVRILDSSGRLMEL